MWMSGVRAREAAVLPDPSDWRGSHSSSQGTRGPVLRLVSQEAGSSTPTGTTDEVRPPPPVGLQLVERVRFRSLSQFRTKGYGYRASDNRTRPHGRLGWKTPSEVHHSPRRMWRKRVKSALTRPDVLSVPRATTLVPAHPSGSLRAASALRLRAGRGELGPRSVRPSLAWPPRLSALPSPRGRRRRSPSSAKEVARSLPKRA